MAVRLVSYSQPTNIFVDKEIKNAQDLIAFCARVSNPSNQINSDAKLAKEILSKNL